MAVSLFGPFRNLQTLVCHLLWAVFRRADIDSMNSGEKRWYHHNHNGSTPNSLFCVFVCVVRIKLLARLLGDISASTQRSFVQLIKSLSCCSNRVPATIASTATLGQERMYGSREMTHLAKHDIPPTQLVHSAIPCTILLFCSSESF